MCLDNYPRECPQLCSMKNLLILVFVLLGLFSANAQLVTKVHDGDTYKVFYHGKLLNVRLRNIDAPELGQNYGFAARDSVAALLTNQTVELDSFGIDMYGRTMGSIRIEGMALDSLMVCKGWAWFYVAYSKDKLLPLYEAAARAKGIGLWQCSKPVPPWVFRKMNKENKRIYDVCGQ